MDKKLAEHIIQIMKNQISLEIADCKQAWKLYLGTCNIIYNPL